MAEEVEIEESEADQEVVDGNSSESEESLKGGDDLGVGNDEPQGDIVVSIDGEDSPPQDDESSTAAPWVRELRKSARQTQKENRDLKAKLLELESNNKATDLGQEPDLSDSDINYDTDIYKRKLAAWMANKRKHDDAQAQAQAEQERQANDWRAKVAAYEAGKGSLKVKNFEDAEAAVQSELSVTKQGIIISGADNPALLVAAIGNSPARLQELSQIDDPVKFAFAVARIESKIKTSQGRKPKTDPEKKVVGSGRASGQDSALERLREEAAKTGDFTKVVAYKRKKQK